MSHEIPILTRGSSGDPRVMLLDEATSALDTQSSWAVFFGGKGQWMRALDWFEGKSRGNYGFYHEI